MNKLQQGIRFTGFIVLSGTVISLLLFSASHAWQTHITGGIITLIVVIGALIAIYYEGKLILDQLKSEAKTQFLKQLLEFSAVFIGGLLTYYLSIDLGLGAVVASSLIAILAHMIAPEYGVPAYCGSFVGMTCNTLLFNPLEVAIASIVAGLIFVITSKFFGGVGGKLGTIALIGTAAAGTGLGRQFLDAPNSDWQTNGLIILIAFIATPLTFYLNGRKGHGAVLASGFVGLLGGLLLPAVMPIYGSTLAVVAICASFTGMSTQERFPAWWHIYIAGLFTGVVFVFSTPLLGGAGGKLGTIAFGSVLAICGYTRIFQQFFNKDARDHSAQTTNLAR